MKNEIKEILDRLKRLCYDNYCLEFSVDYIERKEEKLLLDYITNLQDKVEWYENIEINKTIDKFRLEHNKEIKRLNEENERLKIEWVLVKSALDTSQSRIEKAIDNINITIEIIKQQPTEDDTWILDKLNGFKYLLQGVGKDGND